MKRVFLFLLLFMFPDVGSAGIGAVDRRFYGNWNLFPYSNYVEIKSASGIGTGQFVSPRHVLTNKHVAECCGIGYDRMCSLRLSDSREVRAKLVAVGGGIANCRFQEIPDLTNGQDWAILEVVEEGFEHSYFLLGSTVAGASGLTRAGFGALCVLSDSEISMIKRGWEKYLREAMYTENSVESYMDFGASYHMLKDYTPFLRAFKDQTGEDFASYLFRSECRSKLKVINNCELLTPVVKYDDMIFDHTCDGWTGDSGSALINSANEIVALNNSSRGIIGSVDETDHTFGLYIHEGIKKALADVWVEPKVEKVESENVALRNALATKLGNAVTVPTELIQVAEEKTKTDSSSVAIVAQTTMQSNTETSNVVSKTTAGAVATTGRKIGNQCLASDLPAHASIGNYVKSGLNKFSCEGVQCACAATRCEDGYYLVISSKGHSQGWCYTRTCPSGTRLNVIDGYKTDTKCIAATTLSNNAVNKTTNITNEVNNTTTASTTNNTVVKSGEIKVSETGLPKIGDDCKVSDLPSNATAGRYIKSGKLQCADGKTCSCAATRCKKNYYLMLDSSGNSLGWCRSSYCPGGKRLNIIDGYKTDGCK